MIFTQSAHPHRQIIMAITITSLLLLFYFIFSPQLLRGITRYVGRYAREYSTTTRIRQRVEELTGQRQTRSKRGIACVKAPREKPFNSCFNVFFIFFFPLFIDELVIDE